MKKIRFLAIFLVLLMVAMPIFTACNKTPEEPVDPGTGDTTDTPGTPPKPDDGRPPRQPNPTKEGYVNYDDFNSQALGVFGGNKTVVTAAKDGVSYAVVETDNYKEGETTAKALQIYRDQRDTTTNRDGFVNLQPSSVILLDNIYAVEFDFLVNEKTTGFFLSGRKAPSGATHFNEFIKYDGSSGKLTANGQVVDTIEQNKWYTVTVMIYDNARYYDVYLNGWKKLGQVDNVNGAYPTRAEQEINVYRIGISGAATAECDLMLDNIAIYVPEDMTNPRPKVYAGNNAVTYEQIVMPQITLFDANTVTSENYMQILTAIMGAESAKLNGYYANEGDEPVTGGTDFNNAYRIEAVSPDGVDHFPLAEKWGDPFSKTDAELEELGYTKYLFFDGYNSGFTAPAFKFDPEFMASCGIPVQTGAEIKKTEDIFTGSDTALYYDISNYSTLEIEFFIPMETRNHPTSDFYQFLVYLASGNRYPAGQNNGISYFNTALKTNDSKFANGTATMTFNIGSMSLTREAKLTTITSVEFRFSGWNNTIGGKSTNTGKQNETWFLSDDHPIAIKSIKLTGGVKVPVQDPADGMDDCTHMTEVEGEEGAVTSVSTMTEVVRIAPTCTDYGYTALKCTLCGKTSPKQPSAEDPMNEILTRPVGHHYGSADENADDYNEREVIYPTCVLGGSSSAKCVDCGVAATLETYAPLGHQYITKIDTVAERISFSCPVCGDYAYSNFTEKMPAYNALQAAMTGAGTTIRGGFYNNELGEGVDYLSGEGTSPKINNWSILLRGSKYDVMTEGEADDMIKFMRLYNKSSAHSYGQIQSIKTSSVEDTILEMTLRNGPMIDGKYPNFGDIWMRDNAYPNDAGKAEIVFASINNGKVTFMNSDFTVELSETKFTHISFVLHFSSNTVDVYVDGVMRAKDIMLNNNANVSSSAFIPHEFRIFQFTGANMPDTWIDIANVYCYSGSFPTFFTDVALDGVVSDYSGTIIDQNFDDGVLDTENVKVDGNASIAENMLVVNGGTSVEFVVDPLMRNSTYLISFDFKGSENNMKSGALFTGIKSNFYGETLYEDILTVDADGDILFYNQIIGNTADDMTVTIAVNEDSKTVDIYVNGEYVATGWFANADYSNVDDVPYVIGYKFACTEGGEYSIDSLLVKTGIYEG